MACMVTVSILWKSRVWINDKSWGNLLIQCLLLLLHIRAERKICGRRQLDEQCSRFRKKRFVEANKMTTLKEE